jgi:hypothetical protein
MDRSKQQRAVDIQNSIRQVLFLDWDPIGVNTNPKLNDEYDSYVAPVYRILTGNRSEDEVIEFLQKTERDQIGLASASAEHLRSGARKRLALDVKLQPKPQRPCIRPEI